MTSVADHRIEQIAPITRLWPLHRMEVVGHTAFVLRCANSTRGLLSLGIFPPSLEVIPNW